MPTNLIYTLQFTHYKLHNKIKDLDKLLSTPPQTLLQLNFWCEVMLLAKCQAIDVVEDALYYLSDQSYRGILGVLGQADRRAVEFKVKLARHLFSIENVEFLVRNLEETVSTALAVTPPNHPSTDSIKTTAISEYLTSETTFLSPKTLLNLSQHFLPKLPQKQLKSTNDITASIILVQQLLLKSQHNRQQIKKYLILYRKENILVYLLEYIVKYDQMDVVDVVVQVAGKLGRIGDVVRVFGAARGRFYGVFWGVLEGNRVMEFPAFVEFMMEYSSVRTIILHQTLYPTIYLPNPPQLPLPQLLSSKNPQIFHYFKQNPQKTASTCLQFYLKQSGFHIPPSKIGDTYSDPLAVIGIVRDYWQDWFHGEVVSYCMWVLMDLRVGMVAAVKGVGEDLGVYRRNLYLALAHIAIPYKANSFVIYYPIQHGYLPQLFRLQSLPTLLTSTPNLPSILWLPTYCLQLPTILRLQNGYLLLLKLLQIKSLNLNLNYQNILHQIQYDIVNGGKGKGKNGRERERGIGIGKGRERGNKRSWGEVGAVLRCLEERRVMRDTVDKLVRALQYFDREYQ